MNFPGRHSTRNIVTLNFHGVGKTTQRLDPGEENVWLSTDHFLEMLDAVKKNDRVQITFDDGNASDIETALPALLDRGLRATFFVLAGRIGQMGFLDAADIRELLSNGMEIGSHGMLHRSWRNMSKPVIQEEIYTAKSRLEEIIGMPVMKAACPFGTYDRVALSQLRKAGFSNVYTSDRGLSRPDQWLQTRNTVHKGDRPELLTELFSETTLSFGTMMRNTKRFIKRWR